MIALPWPPRACSPNARGHWARRAKAAKAYRHACAVLLRASGILAPRSDAILVSVEFQPPDRRRRDLDNLIAALKPGLDGVADALGVDDRRFRLAIEWGPVARGGRVLVRLAEAPGQWQK